MKIFYLLTLINFEAAAFMFMEWLFYIEHQSFEIFPFRVIDVHRMVCGLGQLM